MTSENYYVYILPNLLNYGEYKSILEDSGWGRIENSTHVLDKYSNYRTYTKEIDCEWTLLFREFPILNSSIVVIKCLDSTYEKEYQLKSSDEIFYKILTELKLHGISYFKSYNFEFFNNQKDLIKKKEQCDCFLFSEITYENELHQIDLSSFLLKVNCNRTLNEFIIDNVYTSLALSEIAYDLEHRISNKSKNMEQIDIIKAFWSQKIFLLTCPASKMFPSFFKYNVSIISNLLEDCQMSLVENQINLVENQNNILKQIHSVEGGILFLTFFVIIDVLFTIAFELTHSAQSALIVALIIFYLSSKLPPLKEFIKELSGDGNNKS